MNEKNYVDARKQAGLTREKACVALNVSFGTLINWETGKTNPDANNLREMAKLYGVSSDYLLGIASS